MRDFEIKVRLDIVDDELSPEEITSILGVQPSEAFKKGDIIHGRKKEIKRQTSSWSIKSELSCDHSIEEHTKNILSIIRPKKDKLKQISEKYFTELSIAIYYINDFPEIHFPNELLKEIATLNINIDIDVMDLSDED